LRNQQPAIPALHLVLVSAMSAVLAGCAGVTAGQGPGSEFRDCPDCPIMTVIPAGQFTMGSLPGETQRRGWPANTGGNERPMHEVTISAPFALGKYEVTRGQFAAFVAATGYQATGGCMQFVRGGIGVVNRPENSWRNPGFEQRDDEPVLCASWLDARAYVDWLANSSGQPYRLPSEAEWEYAARAGSRSAFPWGDGMAGACEHANVRADPNWTASQSTTNSDPPFPCNDGYSESAPVGSYRPNPFGLHDMIGNVFEWTEDCNHPGFDGAPADGSAWVDDPACVFRIMKGGSFANAAKQTRSAARVGRPLSGRAPMLGFRVARSLSGAATAARAGTVPVAVSSGSADPADMALFETHCAACHVDGRSFKGIYGRDQQAIEKVIRDGGANTMSMPAWRGQLTADEIRRLASYVRNAAGWQ
jgi:formylglycine-generating enzyme required for sulfatase activity